MSKALEIDSSRRSLLKYTAAGLLAGFGGRLLPHVSSAYAATEGGAKALVVYYSRSGNTRAVAEAIHAAVGGDIVELHRRRIPRRTVRPRIRRSRNWRRATSRL
ncbi:MAG: flavodoxin family protein [Bilophila wadsworthia]